jgi:hypothetical protein
LYGRMRCCVDAYDSHEIGVPYRLPLSVATFCVLYSASLVCLLSRL